MGIVREGCHRLRAEQAGHAYVGSAALVLPAAVLFAWGIVGNSNAMVLIGGLVGFAVLLSTIVVLHQEEVALQGRLDRLEAAAREAEPVGQPG